MLTISSCRGVDPGTVTAVTRWQRGHFCMVRPCEIRSALNGFGERHGSKALPGDMRGPERPLGAFGYQATENRHRPSVALFDALAALCGG